MNDKLKYLKGSNCDLIEVSQHLSIATEEYY
jgi:hypothetical protein